MDLQSKIQELTARFAADLVTALRGASLEDIRAISDGAPQVESEKKASAPKRPRRKRSWRRIKRYRIGK